MDGWMSEVLLLGVSPECHEDGPWVPGWIAIEMRPPPHLLTLAWRCCSPGLTVHTLPSSLGFLLFDRHQATTAARDRSTEGSQQQGSKATNAKTKKKKKESSE